MRRLPDVSVASLYAIICCTFTISVHGQLQKGLTQHARSDATVYNSAKEIISGDYLRWHAGNGIVAVYPESRPSSLANSKELVPSREDLGTERDTARRLLQAVGPSSCQPVPGYTAYAGVDHIGNDLPAPNCVKASVESLAARCNGLPWCASFNTDGCLKYKQNATFADDSNEFCFYVKEVSSGCPAVPGFNVQQSRGYNDMTAGGDISIGRGCFRNVSIAQLAQECRADPTCNAFDSWGCLKNYTFLNDNGLGPSYCFYTKEGGGTAGTTPYCIDGWDSKGTAVGQRNNISDATVCHQICRTTTNCTYTAFDMQNDICYLATDMLIGPQGHTRLDSKLKLCTQGQDPCPSIQGFRAYFGQAFWNYPVNWWLDTCSPDPANGEIAIDNYSQLAAECLATPACAGFQLSGCLAANPAVDLRPGPNCFYERIDISSSPTCPTIPGYTAQTALDHAGNSLDGSCYRNQTLQQTAKDCDSTPDCSAFNSFGCLILGDGLTVNFNGRVDGFCYYTKQSIKNLPITSRQPNEGSGSSTNQCEPVAGYTAFARSDHTGDNIPGLSCINASVQTLAAKCNDLPWCVSFNTDGCLKFKETTTDVNKTNSCLYTKDVTMACPHVRGFTVQQGRGYMEYNTTDGTIDMSNGCFRNVSIAQLAQECQADASCNAFDSWGCLKNYTFLNDNGLGPSYCFYTKEDGGTADTTSYCIPGWDAAGTDVIHYLNVTDNAACQGYCRQNPDCTYSVLDGNGNICWLKKDLLFGNDGTTVQRDNFMLCTKGTPAPPEIPGFRSYFAATNAGSVYGSTCYQGGFLSNTAAQCLDTPGCSGFNRYGCETISSIITARGFPTYYWERIYFQPGNCTEVPGYTALPPGFDHYGDDLLAFSTCGRNLTAAQTAEGCNAAPTCTAFNTLGCLKVGDNITVNDNTLGGSYCYYMKNVNSPSPPSDVTAPPQPLPIPTAGNTTEIPGKQKSITAGALAGIAVGGAVVGLLAVLLAVRLGGYNRKHLPQPPINIDEHEVYVRIMQKFADIPGLKKGEAFTRATAHEYSWTETNSTCFAAVTSNNEDELSVIGPSGPAVELTSQQVREQIQLLRDGLLGRGATALVFKGLWPSRFGRSAVLAFKVLQDGYTADMYTLDSFSYEASVLASLNPPHPNVIRLYGYCLEPPTVCLILEVLPGSLKNRLYPKVSNSPQATVEEGDRAEDSVITLSLASRDNTDTTMQSSLHDAANTSSSTQAPKTNTYVSVSPAPITKMTMLDVLKISIDIATGLKYLHDMPLVTNVAMVDSQPLLPEEPESSVSPTSNIDVHSKKSHKIVHRDLKPANILLDATGCAKITDFGLARRQLQETMETRNLAAGTLPYMAPELLIAKEVHSARFHATNRVDIYSMAMIMWEMLAGRTPWGHMIEQALVNAVLSGRRPELPVEQQNDQPPVPLSEMPASLHALPEFNNIIRACWNHREHQRPSAAALYDMLISLRDKYS